MFKKAIKKFFSILGLQISKAQKPGGPDKFTLNGQITLFEWLRDYKFATIIDVGANEGQFVDKIAGVFPDACIHCFEPIKSVYEQLTARFYGNKNLITYNFGLGETSEERMIHLNEYSPSSSLLDMLDLHKTNFDFAVKSEPACISLKRLDDVFTSPPTSPVLLKIDVQGYEMNVLKGGDRVARAADVVIIETTFTPLYKDQPLFAEIYDYFVARGFRYAGNIEQLISPKNYQILQADAVFIKS